MSRSTPPPRHRLGWRVIHLSTVSSTNDYAKRLARLGQPHGTVVMADEQTRGRGQRGRGWASPPGGLWASILVRPSSISTEQTGLLNVAAAAAAAEAVSAMSHARIALKWPNDLLLSGHKVGGVLVEARARGGRVVWVVVGVGINANNPPETLPPSLRASATSLRHELRRRIGVKSLLRGICAHLDGMLELLEAGDNQRVIERWRHFDVTPGRSVRALGDGSLLGIAVSVDTDGRLVVRAPRGDRVTHTTSAGIMID